MYLPTSLLFSIPVVILQIENDEDRQLVISLYQRYKINMYYESLNVVEDEHIAEDLVQESFVNIIKHLDKVKNAGSIFLGRNAPEALGDYLAGPNHTLPTGGIAKFASPLGVDDFMKKSQFTYYTREALEKVSGKIALFAREEELECHARSALARFDETV